MGDETIYYRIRCVGSIFTTALHLYKHKRSATLLKDLIFLFKTAHRLLTCKLMEFFGWTKAGNPFVRVFFKGSVRIVLEHFAATD